MNKEQKKIADDMARCLKTVSKHYGGFAVIDEVLKNWEQACIDEAEADDFFKCSDLPVILKEQAV